MKYTKQDYIKPLDEAEIYRSYRNSKHKDRQIKILAELNAVPESRIREIVIINENRVISECISNTTVKAEGLRMIRKGRKERECIVYIGSKFKNVSFDMAKRIYKGYVDNENTVSDRWGKESLVNSSIIEAVEEISKSGEKIESSKKSDKNNQK